MSDHVDGPRSIGEPAADLTDLFAFTSPENAARTVLGACVFPSAGEDAMFSNAIDYSIAVRRVIVAGVGAAAKFQPGDDEIRFSFRFEILSADDAGQPIQRGVCTLPDGRKLSLTVNDETGASTPEGDVRAFAGLRSDPSTLPGTWASSRKLPNLLQNTNVLSLVVELDTRRVLEPAKGSLFGAIAETVPISKQGTLLGPPLLRIDWVGRPEQTNIRLHNPAMSGIDDIRDLWNQQTPFAIPKARQPLFLQRLKDSFATWDLMDGTADWTPEALAANASVFLDDFLLFDVAKPITDDSHLEIEKSTIGGRPYHTGGGRTIDANSIDILLTWLVNRDREFLQGGATGATKPGLKVFPYFASAEHGTADRRRIHRGRSIARRGMVVDRRLRRRLASPDCPSRRDGYRNRSAPHDRDARWQRNRRATRGDRQCEAVLSLHQHRRDAGLPLHRHARSEAQRQRQRGRLAHPIRGAPSHRPGREGPGSTLLNTGLESLKSHFGGAP